MCIRDRAGASDEQEACMGHFGLHAPNSSRIAHWELLVVVLKQVPSQELCSERNPFWPTSELKTLAGVGHTLLTTRLLCGVGDPAGVMRSDNRVSAVLEFFTTAQRRHTDTPFLKAGVLVSAHLDRLLRQEQAYLTLWQSKANLCGVEHAEAVAALLQRAPMLFNLKDRLSMVKYTAAGPDGDPVRIEVQRENLLASAMSAFAGLKRSDHQRKLKVTFAGEKAVDINGVRREFVTMVCKELFGRKDLFLHTEQHQCYPNPAAKQKRLLKYYEFAGILMAKAFVEGDILDVSLCAFVFKRLLGSALCYHDMAAVDADFYHHNLLWMTTHSIEGVLFLDFVADGVNGKEVELCAAGKTKRVTDQNKFEYLGLLVDYKLNIELQPQLQAIVTGFSLVLNPMDLQLLGAEELQQVLCGQPRLDPLELQQCCALTQGYTPESGTIGLLWNVLQGFDETTQRAFLRFVTGSTRAPAGGLGELDPKFTIQRVDDTEKLPSASTCFNLLKLPAYESEAVLEEKLRMSISEGVLAGFAFS
eukprot:TRINITY_DN4385_c0_g1_i2.p1 TRINITY_DN4385_c0_g1~~TRINITY_DN4385_c0_g1_i2.p1  ORF type:complete len:531 (+),score=167.39 TRINITY_DN4385_c0_g1_i2:100-1692(+)